MEQIVLKLGFYFLALILAYVLKLVGIFKKEDSSTVMALVMNVCLPATAICAFADLEREFSMLIVVVLGFVMGFAPWFLAALTSRKMERSSRVVFLCGSTTLNLGGFTMPFLQLVLPGAAIAGVCLFDIGNSISAHILPVAATSRLLPQSKEQREGPSPTMKMLKSVALWAYVFMLLLFLFNIRLPKLAYTVLNSFALPNGFLIMFNLGLLLEFNFTGSQFRSILGLLAVRLSCATVFAFLLYYLLPFSYEIRKGLVMGAFSPIGAIVPYLTGVCNGDESLSSLAITISELVGTACMVALIFLL